MLEPDRNRTCISLFDSKCATNELVLWLRYRKGKYTIAYLRLEDDSLNMILCFNSNPTMFVSSELYTTVKF